MLAFFSHTIFGFEYYFYAVATLSPSILCFKRNACGRVRNQRCLTRSCKLGQQKLSVWYRILSPRMSILPGCRNRSVTRKKDKQNRWLRLKCWCAHRAQLPRKTLGKYSTTRQHDLPARVVSTRESRHIGELPVLRLLQVSSKPGGYESCRHKF